MVFMKPSHSIEISWDTFRRGTRSFRVPGMSQDLGDPKYEDFLLRSFEQVEPWLERCCSGARVPGQSWGSLSDASWICMSYLIS